MAIYANCIPALIEAEGDTYKDNPGDYGGGTKYGISSREYPNVDIANLTPEQRDEIYQRDYWIKYQLDRINDQEVADQVFLLLINMNPVEAIKIVQCAIMVHMPLVIDGILGDETFQAINNANWECLSDSIRLTSITRYLQKVDEDSSQLVNLRSWIRRALI